MSILGAHDGQVDGRSRVSNFWIPTGGISKKPVIGEKGESMPSQKVVKH